MPPEDASASNRSGASSPRADVPEIEDAYAAEEAQADSQIVGDDDEQLLDPAARALEGEAAPPDGAGAEPSLSVDPAARQRVDQDDTSDTGAVPDEPATTAAVEPATKRTNWDRELSARRIVVELKRIESEVRRILSNRDVKRRRKLGGTRRWLELEEDVASSSFTSRIDEPTLRRLQELIARRHYLFKRLRFVTGTRPTWNT